MSEPVSVIEEERLQALYEYDVLDTPPEEAFDRITRLLKSSLSVPIALVSLVDRDRQWFKSRQGVDVCETPRGISFCTHAIRGNEPFVVNDASSDARFSGNPLVNGEPFIRFYLGIPLRTPAGHNVGTLCAIDTIPRWPTNTELSVMNDLAGLVVDGLEMRRTAGRLRASEERIRTVLNTVLDGIITIDDAGIISTFNPAAEAVFGYSQSETVGRNVKMLMPEPYHSEHDHYLGSYAKTGMAKVIGIGREVVGRKKGGATFPMNLAVSKMEVGERRSYVGIVRDITDRKQAEAAKRDFISTVSHELRTPLTSIKGALGLMQAGTAGKLPDTLQKMLEIAYSNSDRLISIINDMLDIDKIEGGKMSFRMEQLDLTTMIAKAAELNAGLCSVHNISCRVNNQLSDAFVMGDEQRLLQVFANLISNAAKFSAPGDYIDVTLDEHAGLFRISVKDCGSGVPDEFRDKIFQKFTQADSSDSRGKGGTGLGLSISKLIVENHGGNIGFESTPGDGATFYFDLPKAAAGGARVDASPKHLCGRNVNFATDHGATTQVR